MKLIVGLGNPGRKYSLTRHNLGFRVISELAEEYHITVNRHKFNAILGTGIIEERKVILAQPTTFMNNSGQAVARLFSYYNEQIELKDIIVVHDDLDLPPGKIRIKKGGSSAGHKGLDSIINHLGTPGFSRIRIGIGDPEEGIEVRDYVLSRFSPVEEELIESAIKEVLEAIGVICRKGLTAAMNKFN